MVSIRYPRPCPCPAYGTIYLGTYLHNKVRQVGTCLPMIQILYFTYLLYLPRLTRYQSILMQERVGKYSIEFHSFFCRTSFKYAVQRSINSRHGRQRFSPKKNRPSSLFGTTMNAKSEGRKMSYQEAGGSTCLPYRVSKIHRQVPIGFWGVR